MLSYQYRIQPHTSFRTVPDFENPYVENPAKWCTPEGMLYGANTLSPDWISVDGPMVENTQLPMYDLSKAGWLSHYVDSAYDAGFMSSYKKERYPFYGLDST